MDTTQAIPAHCGHYHDVEGTMLKRIVLTTVLLIGAPVTVVAKVSLENIRQPEAAVEELRSDLPHARFGFLHARRRDFHHG